MNTHLKQLWAAMKLPKNFKKSYKFFCLGLDIRVTQNMWVNFSDPGLIQVTLDALAVTAWFYRPFLVPGEKPCGIAVFSVQLA